LSEKNSKHLSSIATPCTEITLQLPSQKRPNSNEVKEYKIQMNFKTKQKIYGG
jgi:hypothetical protein